MIPNDHEPPAINEPDDSKCSRENAAPNNQTPSPSKKQDDLPSSSDQGLHTPNDAEPSSREDRIDADADQPIAPSMGENPFPFWPDEPAGVISGDAKTVIADLKRRWPKVVRRWNNPDQENEKKDEPDH
jgi:hypothetical protein